MSKDWETLVESFKESSDWELEDCYWRPIWSISQSIPTVACMQYFDEMGVDSTMYLTDIKFPTEELAHVWLDEWIESVDWDSYRRWEIKGRSRR